MSNITKIQTILDNAVIKQEFIGFIADVEFNDISVYNTVLSLLKELNNKFKTLNNIKEFVRLLKESIESILGKESIELDRYIEFCKQYTINYEVNETKIAAVQSIQAIFSQNIKNANKLEDIQFETYTTTDIIKTFNHMIKNRKFNYTILSDEECDIISKDNLFTPNEIEEYLNGKVLNQNRKATIEFYFNLIQKDKGENHE